MLVVEVELNDPYGFTGVLLVDVVDVVPVGKDPYGFTGMLEVFVPVIP